MNKRVALITGAGSGLGKALANTYLDRGYKLVLTDLNKPELSKFKRSSSEIDIVIGDLTHSQTIERLTKLIARKHHRLDILINNAAIIYIQPFQENTAEQIDRILNVNLRAAMKLTHAVYHMMKKQRSGHIINIISNAGKYGKSEHTLYSAAKFGLSGFSQSLRFEARTFRIKVSAIYPGGMKTNLYNGIVPKVDTSRFMDPIEVAKVIADISELESISPDELVLNPL